MVNLDQYKKKSKSEIKLPDWALKSSDLIQRIYKDTFKLFDEISEQIETGTALTTKQREIKNTELARRVDCPRSSIRKDRDIDLYKHINALNKRLIALWDVHLKHKTEYKSRTDLENENKLLKRELAAVKNTNLVDYFHESLNNHTLKSMRTLQIQAKQDKADIDDLLYTCQNLRNKLSEMLKSTNS